MHDTHRRLLSNLLFSVGYPIEFGGELMITHVVLVKLKYRSNKNIESMTMLLKSLNGRIPSLRQLEVGKDITRSDRSYDVALIAKFDDLTGLTEYRTHPIHLPVFDKLMNLASSIVVVDFKSD